MDTSYIIRKPLCKNFYYKNLPKLEKPEFREAPHNFRVSALKISPHPFLKSKRPTITKANAYTKEKAQTNYSLNCRFPQTSGILQNSTSQESLNIDSNRAYWKKLEETDNRLQLQTRTSMFKKESANFVIKTLYMPQTTKNILGKNLVCQCLRYRRFLSLLENDPYHATNIFALPKTTSFYELLNIHYENPTFFPYFNKNTREISKETIVVPIKFPAPNTLEDTSMEAIKKPSIKPITLFPALKKHFSAHQKVTCPKNYILINFESINTNNSIILRPGILETLCILSTHFQIILLTSEFEDRALDIKEDLELDDVKISGIYSVTGTNARTSKLLDLSEIFKDFSIDHPEKACVLISHHFIAEDTEGSEYIGSQFGSSLRINCDKIPVVREQFTSVPIEILLPSLKSGKFPELFKRVSNCMIEYLNSHYYQRLEFNFKVILKKKFSLIKSQLPTVMLKKYLASEHFSSYVFRTDLKHLFIVN